MNRKYQGIFNQLQKNQDSLAAKARKMMHRHVQSHIVGWGDVDQPKNIPDWFYHHVERILHTHKKQMYQQFLDRTVDQIKILTGKKERHMAATNQWYWNSTSTTNATTSTVYVDLSSHISSVVHDPYTSMRNILPPDVEVLDGDRFSDDYVGLELSEAFHGEIRLPDKSIIRIRDGNYTIEDENARIKYRANRNRAYNKYITGSDLLEEFIGDLAKLGVTQEQFMNLPVNAFITWLIYKAAEKDQEGHQFRCMGCGKFTQSGLIFCNSDHLQKVVA